MMSRQENQTKRTVEEELQPPMHDSIPQETSRFGPAAMSGLLSRLADPDLAWPVIHVAGTNGKGTVSAAVATLLASTGLRVGLFTSPHLLTRRERFRILMGGSERDQAASLAKELGGFPAPAYGRLLPQDLNSFEDNEDAGRLTGPHEDGGSASKSLSRAGQQSASSDIIFELWPTEETLGRLILPIQKAAQGIPNAGKLTYFEEMTALACLWFKECACDCCVFEVGLGGALDATNALRSSKIAVLTSIGRDHENLLGHDLATIANTKAGIINGRTTAVFLYPPDLLAEAQKDRERVEKAILCRAEQFNLQVAVPDLGPGAERAGFDLLNRRLAVAIFQKLVLKNWAHLFPGGQATAKSNQSAFRTRADRLVSRLRWAGRLSKLHQEPPVIFDGAHNPAAMRALVNYIPSFLTRLYADKEGATGRSSEKAPPAERLRLHLVPGFLADKNWEQMAQFLYSLSDQFHLRIYCVTPQSDRALPAERAAAFFEQLFSASKNRYNSLDITHCHHLTEALKKALMKAGQTEPVFICGSLYMYEEALQAVAECFREDKLELG